MATSFRSRVTSGGRGSKVDPLVMDRGIDSVLDSQKFDIGIGHDSHPLNSKTSLREEIEFYLATSRVGMILDTINTVLSLISCLLYVLETYVWDDRTACSALLDIQLGISCVYILDFLLRFLVAEKKFWFLITVESILDIITIVPGILEWFMDHNGTYNHEVLMIELSWLSALRILRVTRIFRVYRIKRLFTFVESEILRQVYLMSLSVLCLIYFTTGLIHIVENTASLWPSDKTPKQHTFFDIIYLVVTTITTVGYGDINPVTIPGRAFIMLMMCTTLILVPRQTNKLIALMSMTSVYARQSYKHNEQTPHVVVSGEVHGPGVLDFFREFFHPDHGAANKNAVIIGNGLPGQEVRSLLSDPKFAYSLTYLDGNVMSDRDLKRAAVEHAAGIFLLTNKFSQTPNQDDASSILKALSIQRFCRKQQEEHESKRKHKSEKKSANVFCLQLLSSESRKLFTSATKQMRGAVAQYHNQLVCIDEIKMNILAKSILLPGLVTFINNVIASSEELNLSSSDSPWLVEYAGGVGYEIYRVKLSESFEGLTFQNVCQIVHEVNGSVVFALELIHPVAGSRVSLNPSNFIIPEQSSELEVFVFMLAGDLEEALTVSTANLQSLETEDGKKRRRSLFFDKKSETTGAFGLSERIQKARKENLNNSSSDSEQKSNNHDFKMNLKKTLELGANRKGIIGQKRRSSKLWSTVGNVLKKDDESARSKLETEYYVFEEPVSLEDAILSSVNFKNHIVLFGEAGHLYNFVLPLRSRKLEKATPIIVMSETMPSPSEWQSLALFQEVYFMKGNPLMLHDLHRVKIASASRAIIFAKAYTSQYRDCEALVDADAIFAYALLQKENPDLVVIIELVASSNINFIADTDTQGPSKGPTASKYIYAPPFAAGRIYTSSMLDTLVGQAFYNSKLTKILQHLVVGPDWDSVKRWESIVEDVIPQKLVESELYLMPVPKEFKNATYNSLFTHLIGKNIIPFGVRRGIPLGEHINRQGASMPYVVTNPSKDMILNEEDSLFVLSSVPIHILNESANTSSSHSSQETKDDEENSKDLCKAQKAIKKIATPVADMLQDLQKDIDGEFSMLNNGMKEIMAKLSKLEEKAIIIP